VNHLISQFYYRHFSHSSITQQAVWFAACKSKWIRKEGDLITKEHTIKGHADRRTDSFIVIIIM